MPIVRKTPYQAQTGVFTFAQNNSTTNYLRLAYVQALSLKIVSPNALYAVAVDPQTREAMQDCYLDVFDYVIDIDDDHAAGTDLKMMNEWKAFALTPFKETLKVESDLLFTQPIDDWWAAFRLRNVVLNTGCKNYQQQTSPVRRYRKLFDDNGLPDVYNGLMYFRFSREATQFFALAEQIFLNWSEIQKSALQNCRDNEPTTDVVYAIAASMMGVEHCTIPTLDHINFVHMKSGIQGWPDSNEWTDYCNVEVAPPAIRINNVNQLAPVHYHIKDFITEEIEQAYERAYRTTKGI